MRRTEYKPARLRITRNLFFGLLVFSYLVYTGAGDRQILILILLIVTIVFVPQTIRLLIRREALIIDEIGITDFTRPLGFIPWNNIKGVELKTLFLTQSLSLDLKDPDAVVQKLPFVQRMLANSAIRRGTGLNIAIGFVSCDPFQVADLINGRIPGHHSISSSPKAASQERTLKGNAPQMASRVIYSFKNPLAAVLLIAAVALFIIYMPDMFKGLSLKDEIWTIILYVFMVPWMVYSALSYKKVDGDCIYTKIFGIEISRFDIGSTSRIFKHGYDHLQDYGLQDYLNGDMIIGTWTIEGNVDGNRRQCNIGRFNTSVADILQYVVGRCPYKVDLDGDAWAKLKGIDWLR